MTFSHANSHSFLGTEYLPVTAKTMIARLEINPEMAYEDLRQHIVYLCDSFWSQGVARAILHYIDERIVALQNYVHVINIAHFFMRSPIKLTLHRSYRFDIPYPFDGDAFDRSVRNAAEYLRVPEAQIIASCKERMLEFFIASPSLHKGESVIEDVINARLAIFCKDKIAQRAGDLQLSLLKQFFPDASDVALELAHQQLGINVYSAERASAPIAQLILQQGVLAENKLTIRNRLRSEWMPLIKNTQVQLLDADQVRSIAFAQEPMLEHLAYYVKARQAHAFDA